MSCRSRKVLTEDMEQQGNVLNVGQKRLHGGKKIKGSIFPEEDFERRCQIWVSVEDTDGTS